MNAKRVFAVLVLALPFVAFAWIIGTVGFADATVVANAPRYLDIKSSELSKLDHEQLAKLLARTTEKANQMNSLWTNAKIAYDRLLYVLLGIVTVLSVALSFLLWRTPSNNTVGRDGYLPQ